jgi:hypothetical protein
VTKCLCRPDRQTFCEALEDQGIVRPKCCAVRTRRAIGSDALRAKWSNRMRKNCPLYTAGSDSQRTASAVTGHPPVQRVWLLRPSARMHLKSRSTSGRVLALSRKLWLGPPISSRLSRPVEGRHSSASKPRRWRLETSRSATRAEESHWASPETFLLSARTVPAGICRSDVWSRRFSVGLRVRVVRDEVIHAGQSPTGLRVC